MTTNRPAGIAAAVLEESPPERFGAITGAVRELPPDKLNLEALSALADAAKGQTGAADRVARWLGEIAESQPPIDETMAILPALARMTDGARGANGLMQIVEEGSDSEQRKAAIATGLPHDKPMLPSAGSEASYRPYLQMTLATDRTAAESLERPLLATAAYWSRTVFETNDILKLQALTPLRIVNRRTTIFVRKKIHLQGRNKSL